jgi:ABC-2 type transport system permease protein
MTGLRQITLSEARLLLRDATALSVVLALPLGFLLIFGSMGSAGPVPGTDPRGSHAFLAAMAVALSVGMLGLFTMPTYLGTYREKGILRWLAVTPVHPAALLVAQLVVHVLMALAGLGLVLLVGAAVVDVRPPANPVGFLIAFTLGVGALLATGLLVAAVAPNGRAAGGLGSLLFYPLLFFAGAWMPKAQMPAPLARLADFTPVSAMVDALADTWAGRAPDPLNLLVLAATTVLLSALAARWFRWQ